MNTSATNIEFWFEFGSTYSYPAAMRIDALAAKRGVGVSWRAFLLGPIFRDQGWNDSPFNLYASKGRYMWRDLERICTAQGIPFRRPSEFPRNGLLAARVACRFSEAASPDSKARLRRQTEEASKLGIFGAPSFLVGGELFWGNDRLDDALSWAVAHAD